MNKKGLAVLLRSRMRPPCNQPPPPTSPLPDAQSLPIPRVDTDGNKTDSIELLRNVKEWMHASISIPDDKTETVDASLRDFSQGYLELSEECRRDILLALARDYDVNRMHVHELMQQYLTLEIPHAGDQCCGILEDERALTTFYRMERNLRDALKPMYALFFERLNAHPGGLKLLTVLRADLHSVQVKENIPSLRALDSYLKEKLITWLSPAALELHQITWDDSASLLENIVVYEAVHPIRNLLDLKRRLSVGRRCFGYLHPAIPGEPLIFIEVALLKDVAKSIQEVLWDDPPTPECEAKCALFYSISSTQPGLSGINLGQFLIKRVVELLLRDMPFVTTFATLSPIPGYMQWLLSKLASQIKLAKLENVDVTNMLKNDSSSAFKESIILPEEEKFLLNSSVEYGAGESGMEVMWNLLTSSNSEWKRNNHVLAALKAPLMRLCARYLLKEKKRGKALDPVANFHLQNGAVVERINWMADPSEKGIQQSGGIMVNYVYRLDKIEENAQSYFHSGSISVSDDLHCHEEVGGAGELCAMGTSCVE